jgi:microcystin-dependent protein
MAFDFPTNPAIDQVHIEAGVSYIWNGVGWLLGEPPRPPPVSYIDFPAGVKVDFFGSVYLPGTRWCDGALLLRADFPALYAAIGDAYGVNDGSTNFMVPDLRGRVTAGKDDMGGTPASRLTNSGTGNPGINGSVLGAAGGLDRHIVTLAETPSHTHTVYDDTIAGLTPAATTMFCGGEAGRESGAVGSSSAHNNTQPTIICNALITTGGVP